MKIFEPVDGFEPPTCCLQNSCSTTELYRQFKYSSGRRGSNPRPSAWKADALPTELLPLLLSSRQDSNLRILGPKPSLLDLWSTTRLFYILCGRRDSNSHAFQHLLLRQACLPFHHSHKHQISINQ